MEEKKVISLLFATLLIIVAVLVVRVYESPVMNVKRVGVKPELIHLRLGVNIPEETALYAAAVRFSEEVARKSSGRLKVTVHPGQSLGNDNQMVEMARRGELALVLTPTAKLSTAVPAMQVLDLPFFFSSPEALYTALDGEFGQQLLAKLDPIGLRGVAFWGNGFKHFIANRPLHSPSDFSGLTMRIMKSPIIQEQFELLGATTLPIDFHSTYKALVDGVVDGQENPLVAIVSMDFLTVQSHLTLSNHAYLGYLFSISKKRLNELALDDQRILVQTAEEMTHWEREETLRREQGFLDKIRQAGMVVGQLSQEEIQVFQGVLNHLSRKFEPILGADIISLAQESILLSRLESDTPTPLLIGLDLDLSLINPQASLALKQGVELAIHEINQEGGVLGRPLSLIAKDNQAIPERGRDNVVNFHLFDSLIAIITGKAWPVLSAELELAGELGIPLLLPWEKSQGPDIEGDQPSQWVVHSPSINWLLEEVLQREKQLLDAYQHYFHLKPNRKLLRKAGFFYGYELVYLLKEAILKGGDLDRERVMAHLVAGVKQREKEGQALLRTEAR
ncbi:MAG: DctP family TRAP transporter solute-binding subunit [Magnetococcales bacterium]|nr:DctP family TRAP transporter solute-binding subunit [Magnetococcales bacterium]